jgi:hypothetical protein
MLFNFQIQIHYDTIMKLVLKIVSKHQLKLLLSLFFLSLLLNTYEMLFSLIKSEAIFNNGRPNDIVNGEGYLAMIAYCSLVGIAFCLFSAYLNHDFRKDNFPDMSFKQFKDEPQFNLRDWTNFNESCQKEIERLKRVLSQTEGGEKEEVIENRPRNRIGIALPSLFNSATLEADEMTNLKNKINQTKLRRMKPENALNL